MRVVLVVCAVSVFLRRGDGDEPEKAHSLASRGDIGEEPEEAHALASRGDHSDEPGKAHADHVAVWVNADYVDGSKVQNLMRVTAYDWTVEPLLKLELEESKTLIVPELEYQSLEAIPGANETIKRYASRGHVLIMCLGDSVGMDFPVTFLNDLFGWHLQGAEANGGQTVKKDVAGLAFVYSGGPDELPEGTHGLAESSLPSNARCVYRHTGQGVPTCPVVLLPTRKGAVVAIGASFVNPLDEKWTQVWKATMTFADTLEEVLRGNATIAGSGTQWSSSGSLEVFGHDKVKETDCIGWRRTANCQPSGPRLPTLDRNCSDLIPPDESGYCECGNNQLTGAATCSHRVFTCNKMCGHLGRQFREVYGDAYTPPGAEQMIAKLDAAEEMYQNTRVLADDAVSKVNRAIRKSQKLQKEMLAKAQPKGDPWLIAAKAGREAEAAGLDAQHLADHHADPYMPGYVL